MVPPNPRLRSCCLKDFIFFVWCHVSTPKKSTVSIVTRIFQNLAHLLFDHRPHAQVLPQERLAFLREKTEKIKRRKAGCSVISCFLNLGPTSAPRQKTDSFRFLHGYFELSKYPCKKLKTVGLLTSGSTTGSMRRFFRRKDWRSRRKT